MSVWYKIKVYDVHKLLFWSWYLLCILYPADIRRWINVMKMVGFENWINVIFATLDQRLDLTDGSTLGFQR